MNALRTLLVRGLALWAMASPARSAEPARTFTAFSMQVAEARLHDGGGAGGVTVSSLGRITRVTGLVVDPATRDCIVVGERDPARPALHLEDLVVMLRSAFLHRHTEPPGVTIDPAERNPRHAPQKVRYFGHIEGTRSGRICFGGDLLMKQIGLGLRSPRAPGVRSYFGLAVEEAKRTGRRRTEVGSRYWYYPIVARVLSVGNGVLLDRCEMAVLTEILSARVDGRPVANLAAFTHEPSERFAASFTAHFDELAREWKVIGELRSLAALSALSRGLARTNVRPDLGYWLREYAVPEVETPTEVEVLRNVNRELRFEVYGGVSLEALSVRLKEGDLTAFSEAVLAARPSPDALTWTLVVTPERDILAPIRAGSVEAASAAEAYARGLHLFRARRYDRAIACWFAAARLCPEAGEIPYRIGQAFERKGMPGCAADYYTKALALDPFLKRFANR